MADDGAVTDAALTSEARAVRDEAAAEERIVRLFERAMARFLAEVEAQAMREASGMTLTASGPVEGEDDYVPPSQRRGALHVTLGSVTEAWLWALGGAVAALGAIKPERTREAYTTGLWRRLSEAAVVGTVYDSTRTILAAATGQGWSRSTLARALGDALTPSARESRATPLGRIEYDGPVTGTGMTFKGTAEQMGRTAAADAYNSAALDRMGSDMPDGTQKRWRCHHDDRTRKTHRDADGQTVPLDDPFHVGRDLLMYPGDSMGSAGETINCRCSVMAVPPDEEGKIGKPPTRSGMYQGAWGGYNAPE